MPTFTLQEVDDCIYPSGTGINPGTWTLFVKYQVLENGKPIYGSDLKSVVVTENVVNGPNSNIKNTGGAWCINGGSCGAGGMDSSGNFWDMLSGQGTASQTFLVGGQAVAGVSIGGQQLTTLNNNYNSKGQTISVGGGALVGTSTTRECGTKNGDPTYR